MGQGNTVSVVWIMLEGAKSGVQVYSHDTGGRTVIEPKRLLSWFFEKPLFWVVTIGGTILGFIIFWQLGFAMMIGPYRHLKHRAMSGPGCRAEAERA